MDVDKDMEKLSMSKEKEKADIENMQDMKKMGEENKELKCIVRSQGEIIRNTRKERVQMHKERDLLIEEKRKVELMVGELMKAGHANKENLMKIKFVFDE
ncbi:hypothetical protein ZWY2020_034316 [Hordeum vulgare]|nr:hypothetical protein ZWY2020_034316 [Hordeum vulgare]